uniref:(northern house mosquito) hypothetical protein n=1 Tax=Culex pipiens TaxID=7175 RepID=A0A8D8HS96_CULPI
MFSSLSHGAARRRLAGSWGNLINACMACPPGMLRDRAVSGGCPLGPGQSSSGTFHSEGAGGTTASAVRRPGRGAPAQATKHIPHAGLHDVPAAERDGSWAGV